LTSKKAKIDDRTKNMLASDSVVVISLESARKLETEILEWNELEQRIYSTEFVKITTENEIIKGYGFESDPNLTDYKLHKVSGIQNISGVDNE
jgi:LPS export ABC transporter protein LptC